MDANTAALSVLADIEQLCQRSPRIKVVKIFTGATCSVYGYEDKDSPYITKIVGALAEDANKEAAYKAIVAASGSDLKCARLSKNCTGWRYRFPDDCEGRLEALARVKQRIKNTCAGATYVRTETPKLTIEPVAPTPKWVDYETALVKKERKTMNDFSLTNLKNALVDKVTHLDKKTVTILSIIALVLLVFCKYKDIKDIFNGIKKKVVNSDNFKEMINDGTSAVNSLKKIVGIKGDADSET